MKLIVGLGNPGKEYENTRHNIGFMVVDKLAEELSGEFEDDKYLDGSEVIIKDKEVVLFKPGSFMNKSGEPIAKVMAKHDIQLNDLWVIHDDADLEFGQIKVKIGGTSGGHNGIESIDKLVGTDYYRIRVGIGRDANFKELADYVLAPFSAEEREVLPIIIDEVTSYLVKSLKTGINTENFNAKEKRI